MHGRATHESGRGRAGAAPGRPATTGRKLNSEVGRSSGFGSESFRVIDQTGQAAVFESVEGEEVEGGAEEDSSERSGRAGGTGDASVLGLAKYSSGGAFGIGIPGGCAVGIGGGFHFRWFGRFDRRRRRKRPDS